MRTIVLDLKQEEKSAHLYRSRFSVDPKWSLRFRFNVSHALTEVAKGLFRMYPHKLQIAMKQGQSPYLFQFAEGMARDGVKVLEFTEQETAEEILSVVSDDTLFFVLAEDHPMTGEVFQVEEVVKKLVDKKIFTILIRHFHHIANHQRFASHPYLVEICDHNSYASLLLGSRTKKIDSLLLGPEVFTPAIVSEALSESQQQIASFEAQLSSYPDIKLYFSSNQKRFWDRSIFSVNRNAEPLYQKLQKHLNKGKVLTTAKCTYENPFTYAWWRDSQFTDETMNQWLILDVLAVEEIQPKFSEIFKAFLQNS